MPSKQNAIPEILNDHAHSQQLCAPSGAAPLTLTAGGGAWAVGAKVEFVAAATGILDVHHAIVSGVSANADYEIVLYAGAAGAEVEIARTAFTRDSVFTQSLDAWFMCKRQPVGTRISCALLSSVGGSTANIKLLYHYY